MSHDFLLEVGGNCQESNTFFLFWSEVVIIDGKYTFR